MARRRRSKKGKFDDGLNWPVAAAMFTVLVAIAGLIGFSVTSETFDVDEQTLCMGQEPSVWVVIDSTDAIPSGPARRAYHSIMAVDSSPSNTLIQVFQIEGSLPAGEANYFYLQTGRWLQCKRFKRQP